MRGPRASLPLSRSVVGDRWCPSASEQAALSQIAKDEGVSAVWPLANQFSFFLRRRYDLQRWWTVSPMVSVRPLHVHMVAEALRSLTGHHEALRIRWVTRAEGLCQLVLPIGQDEPAVDYIENAPLFSVSAIAAKWVDRVQSSYVWKDPLYRVLCMQIGDGSGRLVFMTHHSIADAYSKRILMEDLERAYFALLHGETVLLPHCSMSYSEFASQSMQFWAERWERELEYWQSLPWGHVRSLSSMGPSDLAVHNIEKHTFDIVQYVDGVGSVADELSGWIPLLLCAIGRAYCEWTGHEVLCLALVVHGREPFKGGINLVRTVGWISETVPILIKPIAIEADFVRSVKDQLYRLLACGRSYGVLKYVADTPAHRKLARHPDPQVSLNVLPARFAERRNPKFERAEEVSLPRVSTDRTLRVFLMSGGAAIQGDKLRLNWEFSDRVFDHERVERFAAACCKHFKLLLSSRYSDCDPSTQLISDSACKRGKLD